MLSVSQFLAVLGLGYLRQQATRWRGSRRHSVYIMERQCQSLKMENTHTWPELCHVRHNVLLFECQGSAPFSPETYRFLAFAWQRDMVVANTPLKRKAWPNFSYFHGKPAVLVEICTWYGSNMFLFLCVLSAFGVCVCPKCFYCSRRCGNSPAPWGGSLSPGGADEEFVTRVCQL